MLYNNTHCQLIHPHAESLPSATKTCTNGRILWPSLASVILEGVVTKWFTITWYCDPLPLRGACNDSPWDKEWTALTRVARRKRGNPWRFNLGFHFEGCFGKSIRKEHVKNTDSYQTPCFVYNWVVGWLVGWLVGLEGRQLLVPKLWGTPPWGEHKLFVWGTYLCFTKYGRKIKYILW
jgi:hypothetical protein